MDEAVTQILSISMIYNITVIHYTESTHTAEQYTILRTIEVRLLTSVCGGEPDPLSEVASSRSIHGSHSVGVLCPR